MSSFMPRSAARRSKSRSRTCNEVSNASAPTDENNADPGTADQPSFAAAHARRSVRQLVSLQPFSYGRIILTFVVFQTSHRLNFRIASDSQAQSKRRSFDIPSAYCPKNQKCIL